MATLKAPFALDRSLNTTEETSRNIADVLAEGLSHITGRTASEVEYDNTDSGLTSDNVQDAIDEVNGKVPTLPTTDIQTAVDEFETYNGGLLSECKVSLSPNQDLHGYSEPWVGGAGKNKLPLTVADIKSYNTSGTWTGNIYSYGGGTLEILVDDDSNVIGFKVNGTFTSTLYFYPHGTTLPSQFLNQSYILSGGDGGVRVRAYHYDGTNNAVSQNGEETSAFTFTTLSSAIDIVIPSGTTVNNITIQPMIRLSTESDPTFAPYSNICPISGHTQVEVGDDGKNRFNPSNVINGYIGQSGGGYKVISLANTRVIYAPCEPNTAYTISKTIGARFGVGWTDTFPDINVTVYGMTTNNTASEITLTTGSTAKYIVAFVWFGTYDTITADEMLASCQIELGSTATAYEPYNGYQITVNLGGTYYSGTLDVVSGVLTVDSAFIASYNGESLPSTWISDRDVYAVGTTPTTGAEVCYKLATPTSIQLSPTMVKALVGENHLSAPLEGQEITESKYKQTFTFDDVIAYIQSLS